MVLILFKNIQSLSEANMTNQVGVFKVLVQDSCTFGRGDLHYFIAGALYQLQIHFWKWFCKKELKEKTF